MDTFPSTVRGILGDMRRGVLASLWRKEWSLPDRGPIVSFTFDDFPRSALEAGGSILKSYDVCGTYYAAMGLLGQINERGEHFSEDDLRRLLADGHELGSHTFNHVSCRSTPSEDFDADALKGRDAVIRFTGTSKPHDFAYPYGDVTLRAKSRVGSQMNSCRSIIDGVNISPVDLHLLLANRLYHSAFDLGVMKHLFQVNDQRRGWLIFYTHDVRDNPSPWGCKPSQFESVVRLAIQNRAEVHTVGSVLEGLPMNPTANTPEN